MNPFLISNYKFFSTIAQNAEEKIVETMNIFRFSN